MSMRLRFRLFGNGSRAPGAAILIPAAFFLSVLSPTVQQPNGLINLAYVGALFLAAAVLSLGVGLIRAVRRSG
jgi:hypothetical protein